MTQWLPAHRAAMVDPYEPFVVWTSREVADQTVRQVIRAGRGGGPVRIRLSNQFGRTSLVLAGAAIEGRENGPLPLRFGGAPQVTIPPGGEAVSDPAPVTVAAGEDATVSLYLPEWTGLATYHPEAHRTGYVAPGNQINATDLTDAQAHTSLYWLSGLDVAASGDRQITIVTLGDSLTDGSATTVDISRTYPDQFAARLHRYRPLAGAAVLNAGLAGNKLLTDVPGEAALLRAERDVFAVPCVSHLIIHLGLNDIGQPSAPGGSPATAEHVISGLTTLARRAHDCGIVPIVGTLTPFLGVRPHDGGRQADSDGLDAPHSDSSNGSEHARQTINAWIRTTPQFAAVVDFDAALADPADPRRLRPAYDSGDHVHPNDAGARAMAEAIDLDLFGHGRHAVQ